MPPEAEPAERAPWPPKDATPEEVSTSTNWWDLGTKFSRDPWDIIFFNFQTFDWQVVNWYMRAYLKCTLPSPDGLSYRFGSSGSPGFKTKVYIPPGSWIAPKKEDEIARDIVRAALHLYTAKRIAFSVFPYKVHFGDLRAIEEQIASRTIAVRHVSGAFDSVQFGVKDGGGAEFRVSFQTATLQRQSMIVHRAIIAHFVLNPSKGSERLGILACAYIGQCLFLIKTGGQKPLLAGFAHQAVMDIAWGIATSITDTGRASSADASALLLAIKAAP